MKVRQMNKTYFAPAILLATVFATPVMAQIAQKTMADYDLIENGGNKDNLLSLDEAERWEAFVRANQPTSNDLSFVNSVLSGIDVNGPRRLKSPPPKDDEEKRVYIQKDRPAVSFKADPKKPGELGQLDSTADFAVLSFKNDRIKGTEIGKAAIGIAYRLSDTETLKPAPGVDDFRVPVSFLFATFSGSFDEDKGDTTQIRAGYQQDWLSFSNNMKTTFKASVSGFALTDLDMEASGYGLDLTVSPSSPPWLWLDPQQPGGKLTFGLNALRVEEGGKTGFQDDKEYAWVFADAKFKFAPELPDWTGKPELTLGWKVGYDLLSDDVEDLASIDLGFPLDKDGDTRIVLSHDVGKDFSNLRATDETELTFQFRF